MTVPSPERLLDQIKSDEPELFGGAAVSLGPIAVKTPNSRIFRLRLDGEISSLALKISEGASLSEDAAELMRLGEKLKSHDDFHVQQLHWQSPDGIAILYDWVEGKTALQAVQSFPPTWKKVRHVAARCGQWLTAFHGNDLVQQGLDLANLLEDVDPNQTGNPPPTNRLERRALNWLERTAEETPTPLCLATTQHGDFKPANIVVSESEVTALDMSSKGTGPIEQDLTQFLNHLCLSLYHPKSCFLLPRGPELESIFLSSYDPNQARANPQVLCWLRIQKLMVHLNAANQTERNSPRHKFLRFALRRELARLLPLA